MKFGSLIVDYTTIDFPTLAREKDSNTIILALVPLMYKVIGHYSAKFPRLHDDIESVGLHALTKSVSIYVNNPERDLTKLVISSINEEERDLIRLAHIVPIKRSTLRRMIKAGKDLSGYTLEYESLDSVEIADSYSFDAYSEIYDRLMLTTKDSIDKEIIDLRLIGKTVTQIAVTVGLTQPSITYRLQRMRKAYAEA